MIDYRVDSIIYQSEIYYRNLVNTLVTDKKLGKALDSEWEKADLILGYLDALNYRDRLTDEEDLAGVNEILFCLIKLCELYQYPVAAPIEFQEPPDVLYGIPGADGIGRQGERGDTGMATDFQVALAAIPTIVDSFLITDAKGARWDYVVINNTGEQRSGSVIGTWSSDGANIEYNDTSTDDIIGTTAPLEFTVQYSGGNIQLVANITSGSWSITGTRYFIPNNGTGTGPISGVLADGTVYIGNSSNLAQSRTLSNAFTITNTGVATLSNNYIVNAYINSAAAISLSKLAALTPTLLNATDSNGIITTLSTSTYPSLTEISFVKGVVSSIQTQINNKLTDPMTSIGDLIIRNGSNITTRLGIGSPGQVLTVSGSLAIWQTPVAGFADPLTTVGDLLYRNSGNVTSRLPIGSASQVLTMSGGIPTWQNPAAGFADPMTTIGDIMIRNGSNVTTRLGIGTSSQVLTVSGGIASWQNIPSSYITGSLTAGRVVLSTGSNTIGDNSGFTWSGGMLTTGKVTLSSTPTSNSSLTQILARDGSTGEVKYRDITTFNNNNFGGFFFGFSSLNNLSGMSGTGSYSIVGEIVHAFGVIYAVVTTGSTSADFLIDLPIGGDNLYGGGGEATAAGTGWSLSAGADGIPSYANWGIQPSGTNKIHITSMGYNFPPFLVDENQPPTYNNGATIKLWVHFTYRRIAV